jgi:hypothetical protein
MSSRALTKIDQAWSGTQCLLVQKSASLRLFAEHEPVSVDASANGSWPKDLQLPYGRLNTRNRFSDQ